MARNSVSTIFLIFIFLASGVKMNASAKNITIVNACREKVWPGIISHHDNFHGSGFTLNPGDYVSYEAPNGWSGRIWARTGCNFNNNSGTCETGSCGPLNCTAAGSKPVTIAEFTIGADNDFYDVSLVDGFNLPISVQPINGKGNCSAAGCDGDLRQNCTSELVLKAHGKVIGCRSACDVFNSDEYCCRGAYGDLASCMPSNYSKSFKQVCPAAASYALDNLSSVITCSATGYVVAFMTISFLVLNPMARKHSLKTGCSY